MREWQARVGREASASIAEVKGTRHLKLDRNNVAGVSLVLDSVDRPRRRISAPGPRIATFRGRVAARATGRRPAALDIRASNDYYRVRTPASAVDGTTTSVHLRDD